MPVVQSQEPVISRPFLATFLAALVARPAAPLIDAAQISLFSAGPAPITPNSTVAEFTECIFDGFATVPFTGVGPVVAIPNGEGIAVTADALFTLTGTAGVDTAAGYYVYDGATLVLAEYFEAPITLSQIGDFISLQMFLALHFINAIGE